MKMPLYFFHIRDGWAVISDEEGMWFSDMNVALTEGYASARDLSAAALADGQYLAACAVEIADETGEILRRIKVDMAYRAA